MNREELARELGQAGAGELLESAQLAWLAVQRQVPAYDDGGLLLVLTPSK